MSKKSLRYIALAAAIVGLSGALANAGPLPGAIFTTNADGSIVNGNTKYLSKCGLTGVWLDGGPPVNAPSTAAGLPDGEYYFQVTDPSGKVLLSTDPVNNRCVTIESGIMTKSNHGNISIRVPNQDAFLMTSGGGLASMKPENIALFRLDGSLIEGNVAPVGGEII